MCCTLSVALPKKCIDVSSPLHQHSEKMVKYVIKSKNITLINGPEKKNNTEKLLFPCFLIFWLFLNPLLGPENNSSGVFFSFRPIDSINFTN